MPLDTDSTRSEYRVNDLPGMSNHRCEQQQSVDGIKAILRANLNASARFCPCFLHECRRSQQCGLNVIECGRSQRVALGGF